MAETVAFRGALAIPTVPSTLTTDEIVCSIENQTGTGVTLHVTQVGMDIGGTQAVMNPFFVAVHQTMPSGGNTATKVKLGGGSTSAAGVVLRTSRLVDDGTATAITTSSPSRAWASMNRNQSQTSSHWKAVPRGMELAPALGYRLAEGWSLSITMNAAASPNSAATGNWDPYLSLMWDELVITADATVYMPAMMAPFQGAR